MFKFLATHKDNNNVIVIFAERDTSSSAYAALGKELQERGLNWNDAHINEKIKYSIKRN